MMSNGNSLFNLVTSGTIINTGLISTANLATVNISTATTRISTSLIGLGNSNTIGNIFTTGGNIGINTTSPANTLDIIGTVRISTSLTTGSLFSTNIVGTNITATNLMMSGGNALFNIVTSGTIINTGLISTANLATVNISSATVSISTSLIGIGNSNTLGSIFTTGGNTGINTGTPLTKLHVNSGSMFVGDVNSGFSTIVPSSNNFNPIANGYRLFFDNSFNNSAGSGMPANKIVLHNNLFTAGFGLELNAVTYHSGSGHRIYCNADSTSTYGSLAMSVFPTQTLVTTNTTTEGLIKISNLNSGGNALSSLRVGNDVGESIMFLNSSTRTADGGPNTLTIRNDLGVLRLQSSAGANTGILISTSGNVGIGTTAPSVLLDVNGLIKTAGCVAMAMNVTDVKAGYTVLIHPYQMEFNSGSAAGVSSGVFQPEWVSGTTGADQGAYYKTSAAIFDFYRAYINIVGGTYTFRLDAGRTSDRAIVTIKLNDVSMGTIDTYTASPTSGPLTLTIMIGTTGVYKLDFQMNTKNASSTGYFFLFRAAAFIRTS